MARASALVLALIVGGCAHGGGSSANLSSKPHGSLALTSPSGAPAGQGEILEDTLCQALVEINHGDVACPSSSRAAVDLQRSRAMMSGDVATAAAPVNGDVSPQVLAAVSQVGKDWVLELSYVEALGAKPLATQKLTAGSFEELVEKAPGAARALLE